MSKIKKKTDWIRYKTLVKNKLQSFKINSSNPTQFDKCALDFANILTSAHAECCKTKIIKGKFYTQWFTPALLKMKTSSSSSVKRGAGVIHGGNLMCLML
jgi:hypothetical protein